MFRWPAPVAVDSRQDGERLTLRFARPFAADLGAVMDALGTNLVGLERGGHGRELVLRLAPGTTARLDVDYDRIVTVDLTPGAAAAPVGVRTGWHDGFLRIVLDWPRPIDFIAEADGGRLRIRFARPAPIDAAMIGKRGQTLLDAAAASAADGWSELRLLLKTGVWAQVYKLEGRLVVIDLYQPPVAGPLAMLPTGAPRPSKPAQPVAMPSGPVPPDVGAAAAELPEPAAAPGSEASPLALQIAATEVGRGIALDFVWSQPTAAAFWIRAGYLWSVFAPVAEPSAAAVLPSLASPAPGWLGPGERIDAAGGTALRFPLQRPLAARVERAGGRWRVVLGATAAPPGAARFERLAEPTRLRVLTGEAPHLIRLADPGVGDRLAVWPLLTPGLGEPQARRLVDLEILATAQGLAWRPIADQLQTQVVDGGVELSVPAGLRLSADPLAPPGRLAEAAEPSPGPAAEPAAEPSAARPGERRVAVRPAPSPAEPPTTEQDTAPIGARRARGLAVGSGRTARHRETGSARRRRTGTSCR